MYTFSRLILPASWYQTRFYHLQEFSVQILLTSVKINCGWIVFSVMSIKHTAWRMKIITKPRFERLLELNSETPTIFLIEYKYQFKDLHYAKIISQRISNIPGIQTIIIELRRGIYLFFFLSVVVKYFNRSNHMELNITLFLDIENSRTTFLFF